MSDFLGVMLWPLLACLVLTGIHAYLGLHVIQREVIFVDLALAQIAALGAGLALLFGHDGHDAWAYGMSLVFTVCGAGIFALTRFRRQRIPQEALIGIVYAVSAAALVMVLSRTGEGDEHIRQMLIGNILLTGPHEVFKMLAIYTVVGLVHFVFRGPFFRISADPQGAFRDGLNVRGWDFLFYATFGIVVTCSVHVVGVLLVFAYLVVPAAAAVLITEDLRARLFLGWIIAAAVSFAGMAVSYFLDYPTGASVVCVFGLALGLVGAITRFKRPA